FNDEGKMLDRSLMISRVVVERAKRKVDERRRVGHRMKHALSALDDLHDFKAVPAPLLIAQDVVGRNKELKDAPGFLMLRALYGAIDKVCDDGKEDYDGRRDAHHAKHGDDDDNRQNSMQRFFALCTHDSLTYVLIRWRIFSPASSVESVPPRSRVVSPAAIAA